MSQNNRKRVLLISNSTLYGSGYLDHAETEIRDFLGSTSEVLFIPYALYDRDSYAATARERFEEWATGWYRFTLLLMPNKPSLMRKQFSLGVVIRFDF